MDWVGDEDFVASTLGMVFWNRQGVVVSQYSVGRVVKLGGVGQIGFSAHCLVCAPYVYC